MISLYTKHCPNPRINSFVWSVFASLLTSIFVLLSPDALHAGSAKPDAGGLTQALIAHSIRYQQASRSEQAYLLNELIETAAIRQELLLSIIENNPAEVIRLAVPASTRAALPPAVQAYIEQEVDIEGTLEVIDEDYEQYNRLLYYLETAGERLSLHFADHRPVHLLTGAKIRVKGIKVDNTLALAGGGGNVKPVVPAPVPSTLGELRTLVILVNFQDKPIEPYTIADAQSALFGETNEFFLENSYQQAWLNGDVVGWYTIPVASTVCDFNAIAFGAQSAAAAAGVNLAAYAHYLFAFPQNACGWWGLSTVGGNPSQSWVNGGLELAVSAHELGHGLGLWHSHALDCGTETIGIVMSSTYPPSPDTCYVIDYGNLIDAMGAAYPGHYNAFQKERLGWLNDGSSPPITTVSTSGTYILEAYESATSGPKALKILKSTDAATGVDTWYYIEARKAIGFDSFLATTASTVGMTSTIQNGVLVSLGTEGNGNASDLLDMSPENDTNIWQWLFNAPLLAGQSFSDPAADFTIKTEWVTNTEAAVTVTFGTGGPDSSVDIAIWTDQSTYTRNESVSIKGTVHSGGAPIANTTVNFKVKKSTGAVVTGKATTDANGMAVYKFRLKRQDPIGTYEADASILSVSAVTEFTVQ
jgi:hypothetical protein